MIDSYERTIRYLRVSVTDRCNLRCRYCMPSDGFKMLRHEDILSFEEMAEVVRTAVELGIVKVRVTGGEPLVRRNVVGFVAMLSAIDGIEDLAMSTNGTLLAEHAQALAEAGLQRVNISLDTMDPDRFRELTGGKGELDAVLAGIEAARRAGLTPIKLNCVVTQSSSEPDARAVARFATENGLEARFIRRMNLAAGSFSIVEGGNGGDCPQCDRLRLSADGRIRPCLFSDLAYSVRELGVREAILQAVRNKPATGLKSKQEGIYAIGG